MIRRPHLAVALCAAGVLAAGCTGAGTAPPTPSAISSASASPAASSLASIVETVPSLTPVTDAGLVTGPGVDDAALSLGLLVDARRDQGFTTGVRLWAKAFNFAGGVCGRSVELLTPSTAQTATDAYRYLAAESLGLITLPALDVRENLDTMVAADRLPAATPEGTIADLRTAGGPIVLGATADILAINTAARWLADGTLTSGSAVAVYLDVSGSDTDATDAASALQWWAARTGVELVLIRPGEQIPDAVRAIYAPGSASGVQELVSRVSAERGIAPAAQTGLATTTPTLPGFRTSAPGTAGPTPSNPVTTSAQTLGSASPAPVDGDAIAIATDLDGASDVLGSETAQGAVTVATVTPAYTAAHPVGSALAQAFANAELTPGRRSFEGYAVGEAWGRVLAPMCAARTLTRAAATAQWAALAPAAADSIIGPSRPADQLTATLPNSRVSALSVVDTDLVTGVRPLTLLESAPDIAAYRGTG